MMNMPHPRRKSLPVPRSGTYSAGRQGQTALEYLLLVGVVVALVLVALKVNLPRTQTSANAYFNRVVDAMVGRPNPCGDGYCCFPFENIDLCPPDCDDTGPGGTDRSACPDAVCTGPFDPGAGTYSICPGSDDELMVSEDWTLVAYNGCSATKCQYQCNSGFMPVGNACVPAVCSGSTASFAGVALCAGSQGGLTVPTSWTVVPDCTGGRCEYECLPGYYQVTAAECVLAECTGSGFASAALCPQDALNLTTSVPYTLVPICSFPDGSDPKCQYACWPSYVIYNGACCLPGCPLGACGPGQNDGCGSTINCPTCCGNGALDPGEVCDTNGPLLAGRQCSDFGSTGTCGSLGCGSDCTTFDTTACQDAVNGTWGDPWTDVGGCGTYTACKQRQQGTCGASCGGSCPGSPYQDVDCGFVQGTWSGWTASACSVSCGGGFLTESRTCNGVACGGECQRLDNSYTTPGNRTESRTLPCNTQACPGGTWTLRTGWGIGGWWHCGTLSCAGTCCFQIGAVVGASCATVGQTCGQPFTPPAICSEGFYIFDCQ